MSPFLQGIINAGDLCAHDIRRLSTGRYQKLGFGDSFLKIRGDFVYPKTVTLRLQAGWVAGYIESNLYKWFVDQLTSGIRISKIIKRLRSDPATEFLIITCDPNLGLISIFRDALCTMPLFYGHHGTVFVVSNDFEYVAHRCRKVDPIPLDAHGLAGALAALEPGNATLLDSVKLLTERTLLTWDGEKISLQVPLSHPLPRVRKIRNPLAVFGRMLKRTILYYIAKIPRNLRMGVELSGGLDSSTVAGCWARATGRNLYAYTMLQQPRHGPWQRLKIARLAEKFSLEPRPISIAKYFPLSDIMRTRKWRVRYSFEEIYSPSLLQQIRTARRDGVQIMLTGMGGDELFMVDRYEVDGTDPRADTKDLPKFFTKKFRNIVNRKRESLPGSLVPYSVLSANIARNNFYIDAGIWPIAPLGDPRFVRFCRSLPARQRQNKKIFREYGATHGYPEEVWQEGINENFGGFFRESLRGPAASILRELFQRRMILERLRFVNAEKLRTAFRSFMAGSKAVNPLYFYTIAVMEMNLRALKSERN